MGNLHTNKAVHALWIGDTLSPVELLCVHSFLAHGHEFHLWLYNELKTPLPEGVIIEDATQIIPTSQVFSYKHTNQFGHGKGSYAGFSDVFRYKLLYDKGGWWTDMDVVCLRPLTFDVPFVFRTHHNLPVVGNIMKCPPNSQLMRDCFEEASALVKADNTDWHLPIAILNKHIVKNGLEQYVKTISNPDRWHVVALFCLFNIKPNNQWAVLHLMNEQWRKNMIDKDGIPDWSTIGRLLLGYNITKRKAFNRNLKNMLNFLF